MKKRLTYVGSTAIVSLGLFLAFELLSKPLNYPFGVQDIWMIPWTGVMWLAGCLDRDLKK